MSISDSLDVFAKILSRNLAPIEPLPMPKLPPIPKFNQIQVSKERPPVDPASYILRHAAHGKTAALDPITSKEGAETEEPGVLSRIFDFVSAPLYAVTGSVDEMIDDFQDGDILEGLGLTPEGVADKFRTGSAAVLRAAAAAPTNIPFTDIDDAAQEYAYEVADKLKPRTLGHDILENIGVDNKYGKAIGGFALDVALDPLTYVPGGLVLKGLKGGARLSGAAAPVAPKIGKAFTQKKNFKLREMAPAEQVVSRTIDFTPTFKPGQFSVPKTPEMASDILVNNISIGKFLKTPEGKKLKARFNRSETAKESKLIKDSIANSKENLDRAYKAQGAFLRDRKLAKNKTVMDKRGNISFTSVENVVERIRNGTVDEFAPNTELATGATAKTARKSMDEVIDKVLNRKGNRAKKISFVPTTQKNLFNKLLDDTSERSKDIFLTSDMKHSNVRQWRYREAVKMLKTAENHAIRLGFNPQYWDGQRVRLSDVLAETNAQTADEITTVVNEFSKRNITESAVRPAIEKQLARRSVVTADILTSLSSRAQEQKALLDQIIEGPSTTAREGEAAIVKNSKSLASKASLTPVEATAIKDIIKEYVDVDKLPTELTIERVGKELIEAVTSGRFSAQAIDALNVKIAQVLGVPYEKLGNNVIGNKAVDSFMLHFTTWWGRGDAKRYMDDVLNWGRRNAEDRAHLLRLRLQRFTPDEQKEALKVAQGLTDASNERVAGLATGYLKHVESLLRISGAQKEFTNLDSVAIRSQLMMDDVNKQLKRMDEAFQFTNKKGIQDFAGRKHDFSQGFDWFDSWKVFNPANPSGFFYNLDLAIERTTKVYAAMDDFAGRWGSRVKDAEHTHGMAHPRLQGYYFPKEVRDQMTRLLEDVEKDVWRPNSAISKMYLHGLKAWKSAVTIYSPSHHIRNLNGDIHLMWWAGHNDPRVFGKSKRILSTQRARYRGAIKEDNMEELERVQYPGALEEAMTRPGDVISRVNGRAVTAEQYYIAAHQRGLLLKASQLEDLWGETPLGELLPQAFREKHPVIAARGTQPFGGKVRGVAQAAAEYREHYVRMAHFIAATQKNLKKTKDIYKAFDDAAHEVRKWHPDGTDLTISEQKYGRTLIPFYSWTRKSMPLIVQSFVTRPSKITYYPKLMIELQEMFGIEGGTLLDPFPDDALFPDWIRSYGVGPVAKAPSFISALGKTVPDPLTGEPSGHTLVNPGNPFQDNLSQLLGTGRWNDIPRGIAEQATPALRVPWEVATGNKSTGMPIELDPSGYVTEQFFPILAPLSRMTNFGVLGPTHQAEKDKTHVDKESILNWLTALGVRGTAPYTKQAEYEARERARRNGN